MIATAVISTVEPGARGVAVIVLIVILEGDLEARKITFDSGIFGFLALGADREKERDGEEGDDRDDNENFDEGKAPLTG